MNEIYLMVAIGGALVSSGILIQKVNDHGKRLNSGDKRLKEHGEAVASMRTSIGHMEKDITEIKGCVKTILRNNKK